MKKSRFYAFIQWFDSFYTENNLQDNTRSEVILVSAGILIQENEQSVTLGLTHDIKDNETRYLITIPKVNILKFKKHAF